MQKINLYLLLLLLIAGFVVTSCANDDDEDTYKDWREFNQNWLMEQVARTNDDGSAYYTRVVMPTDPQAALYMHRFDEANDNDFKPLFTSTVTVNYTLKLANDSIVDQAAGFTSQLSSQSLITGWGLAIMQMNVGDTAQFLLPYNVGYGTTGTVNLPPYSNLQFNIRLVDIDGYEVRP